MPKQHSHHVLLENDNIFSIYCSLKITNPRYDTQAYSYLFLGTVHMTSDKNKIHGTKHKNCKTETS